MNIDVVISAQHIKPEKFKDRIVVVIDVLRATSVMVTALNNGCDKIIPVKEIEEAIDIASKDKNKYLLGGERGGIKIDKFDFSNSPLDYIEDIVKGKSLIMTTTNGTRAIKNSEEAERIFIGALINGRVVAEKLAKLNKDVTFVNAGTDGEFSMDDFITSGYIINCLRDIMKNHCTLTDIAKTSEYVYINNPSIISFVKDALHYKRMKDLRYNEDLRYCLSKDLINIVPEYKDGEIKIY
ncbi:2-phosphosulfolactate phosphatase [Clostridium sulfidigenes]|uniref:Probable 2-phosphosulfolactate phosphatase n=1 Tax=Clostridium sulfidigenes TaxID=318464 RepID=A0A084J8Q7_9CLOT|nr:2-phosphosulfolactate phosphatase [Clostridium sulfidigenes]KEZ85341.1 2-phosphosulfolactate phosphatase [Clostridium sulfidigenes]